MELEMLKSWLLTYPGFAGREVLADCIPQKENTLSVMPQGLKRLTHREDLLGNCTDVLQGVYTLYYTCLPGSWEQAQSLLQFQSWVAEQNAKRLCPQFGGGTQVTAQQGKHLKESRLGMTIYTAQIVVTYEKTYEVRENGEN